MNETSEASTPVRIMRQDEVLDRIGISSVTLWRLERDGEFPRRRRLGGRMVGWRSDEVDAWIESREPVD